MMRVAHLPDIRSQTAVKRYGGQGCQLVKVHVSCSMLTGSEEAAALNLILRALPRPQQQGHGFGDARKLFDPKTLSDAPQPHFILCSNALLLKRKDPLIVMHALGLYVGQ